MQILQKLSAEKRRFLLLVISSLLIVVLVGWMIWGGEKLSPPEQTALTYVQAGYVKYDPEQLRKCLDLERYKPSQFKNSQWVKPGDVRVGSREMPFTTKVVIFFDDRNMSETRNRIEVELKQEGDRWLVIGDAFRGVNSEDFDQFQQSDAYKELGIEKWKSAELSY